MSSTTRTERANGAGSLLALLDLSLPAQPLPLGYFLTLGSVLVGWLFLLLLYAALMAAFAGVFFLGVSLVPEAKGFWSIVFALSLAGCGVLVVLFLVKPVFAPGARSGDRAALHEADEPHLFAYVGRLARLVGARPPDRIVLDTHVNASAGHLDLLDVRRGRLELTLGLPLVTSLSLKELTGILAHEFGHFRQGLGSRLGAIVRSLNRWFYRAAFERDGWDESLADALEDDSGPAFLRLPFVLAALGIAGCRLFLRLELRVGVALSSFWSRQLEYDADRWEAALTGGPAFAESALKLRVLEVSSQWAHDDLAVAMREGRLADDLPSLVAAHASGMPREVVSKIRNAMLAHRTEWMDTHPSDLDRIERARAFPQGLFRSDAPASALFTDLPRVCRTATLRYYREELGLDVTPRNLVPAERLAPGRTAPVRNGEGAGFDRGALGESRLFFLEYGTVPQLPENARGHMKRLRDRFLELASGGRAAGRDLDRAFDLRMRVTAASRLSTAGVALSGSIFNLPSTTEQGLAQARERADGLEKGALATVVEVEKVLRQRMLLALALLRDPELGTTLGGEEALRKAHSLIAGLAALGKVRSELEGLTVDLTALEPILAVLQASETQDEALTQGALELLADVERLLREVQRKIGPALYPWGHVDGEVTLARYLVPEIPPAGEWSRLRAAGHETRQRFLDTHGRVLKELGGMAQSVEAALGLASA